MQQSLYSPQPYWKKWTKQERRQGSNEGGISTKTATCSLSRGKLKGQRCYLMCHIMAWGHCFANEGCASFSRFVQLSKLLFIEEYGADEDGVVVDENVLLVGLAGSHWGHGREQLNIPKISTMQFIMHFIFPFCSSYTGKNDLPSKPHCTMGKDGIYMF